MEKMTIGQRIASRRKLANLSQENLSEQLGLSRQSVSKWESDAGLPDIDNLVALSKIFGVSVGWLLGTEWDPSFDPSMGLSEAQLQMVKKVVEGGRPKRWYRYLVAGIAAVILLPGILSLCVLAHVKNENEKAQQKIVLLEDQVDAMNTLLLKQKRENDLLLSAYATPYLNDDGQAITVDFYFVPKFFQENTRAYLVIRGDVGRPGVEWKQLECSAMGTWYHCRTEISLNDGYHYSFILANDSGFREQQLDDMENIRSLKNLYHAVGYHLDDGAEKRTEWHVKESVYTFEQPIATPCITCRVPKVGYKAVDVTLYHNGTPIHEESLRQAFRDLGGAYMLSGVPLIPDIRAELPALSEGDVLRLEIRTEDYDGHVMINTLEELKVVSAQNG